MKPLWAAVSFVTVLTLVALFSIIKFATEISEIKDEGPSKDIDAFPVFDNLVLRVSTNSGVISLPANHSLVASERYPYVVAITAHQKAGERYRFTCFGCIILMNWIVTAAHCKMPGHSHRILLYYDYVRNHTRTYPIVQWHIHEGYNANNSFPWNDIAVAKVGGNVEPVTYTDFGGPQQKMYASIWKTLLTMDHQTFLTNNMELYDVAIAEPPRCYELYGLLMDESLICVDMSQHTDCFVAEFGPIFTPSERAVGVLALKPKDCDNKLAVFTNVSSYFYWIMKATDMRAPQRTR